MRTSLKTTKLVSKISGHKGKFGIRFGKVSLRCASEQILTFKVKNTQRSVTKEKREKERGRESQMETFTQTQFPEQLSTRAFSSKLLNKLSLEHKTTS